MTINLIYQYFLYQHLMQYNLNDNHDITKNRIENNSHLFEEAMLELHLQIQESIRVNQLRLMMEDRRCIARKID
jgi:hypothetical protein